VKFPPKVLGDFRAKLDRAVKIVAVCDDSEKIGACTAEVQKTLRGQASAQLSQPYYLDVTNPQANKGGVAEFLSQHLKIGLDEMAALGDMPNDVPMFEKCGMSIAMGQSSKEVQNQANFVTTSYEEEGFALALEKHFLS
jgi:hydroxymethylpyrimidine pyrophosphatase-like HAD family hydrolase